MQYDARATSEQHDWAPALDTTTSFQTKMAAPPPPLASPDHTAAASMPPGISTAPTPTITACAWWGYKTREVGLSCGKAKPDEIGRETWEEKRALEPGVLEPFRRVAGAGFEPATFGL